MDARCLPRRKTLSRRVYACPVSAATNGDNVLGYVVHASVAVSVAVLVAGCLHADSERTTASPPPPADVECEAEEVEDTGRIPPGCSPEAVYRIKASAICDSPGAGVPVRRSMLLPRFDVMVNQLRALEPPQSLRARVRGWLGALDEAVRHLKRARAAESAGRAQVVRAELQLFTNLNIRAQFRAEGLDIEGCAETE